MNNVVQIVIAFVAGGALVYVWRWWLARKTQIKTAAGAAADAVKKL